MFNIKFFDLIEILDCYSQKHRFYHNFNHIIDFYNNLKLLKEKGENVCDYHYIAMIYHDVIYNPKRNDNEEKSLELFLSHHKNESNSFIENLILDTKKSTPSSSFSKVFIDADMMILASNKEKYKKYRDGIFKEYSLFFEKNDFIYSRKKWIENVLNKDFIFHTNFCRNNCEKIAKENLKNEIEYWNVEENFNYIKKCFNEKNI